jgi:hypothetical protein
MIEVERLNGINNKSGADVKNKMFKELLIANYPIKELSYLLENNLLKENVG